MMAPSGAPIKKKMMHASDRVIFLCQSERCPLIRPSTSCVVKLFSDHSEASDATRLLVEFSVLYFCAAVRLLNMLSVLMCVIFCSASLVESLAVSGGSLYVRSMASL